MEQPVASVSDRAPGNFLNGLRIVPFNLPSERHGRWNEVSEMTLQTIKTSALKFVRDEDGLTIVEYAVAGGLITVAVAAAFVTLGGQVNTKITALCTAVNGGAACP
jgi:pilus assembly protein Flp/PilA